MGLRHLSWRSDLAFDSVEAFRGSFGPNAAQIQGDVPNYTNVRPMIQISEGKI